MIPAWPKSPKARRNFAAAVLGLSGSGFLCGALFEPVLATGFIKDPLTSHLVQHGDSNPDDPLTYIADHETMDKTGLVTWSGHVRVWQGGQALRADKITLDRPAGLIRAQGHVAIIQPDGSTLYASHMEFVHGLKDGIGHAIYMQMEADAKFASAAMRRSNGELNDFSKAIYTACPVCAKDPTHPPFWEIQAQRAVQDHEHKNIEFDHAWLKIMGLPVLYFPWISMTDPSRKRHSGFMMANVNPHDRYLGTYLTVPYYIVIDNSQDLLLTGLISTKTGPQMSALYRNQLNFGNVRIQGALADDTLKNLKYWNYYGQQSAGDQKGAQGYIFAKGDFTLDSHWKTGADIRLATSADYMRNYRIPGYGGDFLPTTAYLEGYGVGSYARLDIQTYQALNQGVINNSNLPYALPRFTYEFKGEPDKLGGRFSLHTTDFYVYRSQGARDQRGELQMQYDRPFENALGQKWLVSGRLDSVIYNFSQMNAEPNYGPAGSHFRGQVLPTAAVKMNWPFLRTFDHGNGSHVLEPIFQAIVAPNATSQLSTRLPNEDSFDYEFSDATLFSLNRFMGTDRLDGGIRGNVGLHQNWSWRGHVVDMLVGESIQDHVVHNRLPYSGLDHHLSDPVGRINFDPNPYLDLTARGRYNPWRKKFDYGEGLIGVGVPAFRITGGYVYEPRTQYYFYRTDYRRYSPGDFRPFSGSGNNYVNGMYMTPANEATLGFTARWRQYHLSGYTRKNLSDVTKYGLNNGGYKMKKHPFVANGGDFGYENDCFGFDVIWIRQYTYIGGQRRNSTVLLNFYFKTLGTFGTNG